MADALKAEGNKLFAEKKYPEAIEKFSAAIELDQSNHVLYSNRSGAYLSLNNHDDALRDAEKVTEIKKDWPKGWTRKGAALHGAQKLPEALEAYKKALELDENNTQAKQAVQNIQRQLDQRSTNDGMGGLGNIFGDPSAIQKLANNPKTSAYLADRDFIAKIQQLQRNPGGIVQEMNDPRIIQAMGVLMGIDMHMGNPDDFKGQEKPSEAEEDVPMPDLRPQSPKKAPEPKAAPEPEPEPEDEEAAAKREAKAKADEEKKLGTENYKKRNFDEAIAHYSKAWEIHKDITYLNNLGAAKFEKGDFEGAIEACKKAVEEGREILADFKLIAKAFGRMGSAYEKMGDLANAIENYNRSLTEHRTPEILTKLRAAEKAKIKAEKDAYISPEEAEKARELGNAKFKEADWPAAVDAYSEMIKRAPQDARGYSNRAACFIKLLTFPSAVQDCDKAIELDPKFIRAYLRKAQAYFAMREYNKCMDTCDAATLNDEGGKNAREISEQSQKALQAMYSTHEGETEQEAMERIQRDPELVSILQDPAMQSILNQARDNPAALQDHMRNPQVRSKIQRLVGAGVIKLGR